MVPNVTKKFIFLLPKQKYFALALQVKRKVQGVYDFAQINSQQARNHNTIYIVIQLVSKFNCSVCRLVKTVSRAGPQNVMFGNRSARKHLLTGQ